MEQVENVLTSGPKVPCCKRVQSFLYGTKASVYVHHFLSSWGDRMWAFAIGLYVNDLSPESLRVVAAYGFSMAISALCMGAIIGDAVDRYARLKVARTFLVGQNIAVALAAILVCIVYAFKPLIYSNVALLQLCEAGIIMIAIIGNLFSIGTKISVEKDWISVICEGQSDKLAKMSSTMRAIDLVTNILAPVATGFIMTFTSMMASAICMSLWNVISVFVEYALLVRVYKMVPALAIKKSRSKTSEPQTTAEQQENDEKHVIDGEVMHMVTCDKDDDLNPGDVEARVRLMEEYVNPEKDIPDDMITADEDGETAVSSEVSSECDPLSEKGVEHPAVPLEHLATPPTVPLESEYKSGNLVIVKKMFTPFTRLKTGWSAYMSYNVKLAGFGLACLYMTVLGFDNITTGYAYHQGASQAVIGGLRALGALIGVSATFAYPKLRGKLGIERSGLLGFSLEIVCLTLCVVSVWSPGSPFNPSGSSNTASNSSNTSSNSSNTASNSSNTVANSSNTASNTSLVWERQLGEPLKNLTFENQTTQKETLLSNPLVNHSYVSLVLLMSGMIAARFGLWIADLSVNQLMLEKVDPAQRGVVNGVQSSLNMLLEMLKFIVVIAVPKPEQFGLLVLISFAFICLGGFLFTAYCRKVSITIMTCCSNNKDTLDKK